MPGGLGPVWAWVSRRTRGVSEHTKALAAACAVLGTAVSFDMSLDVRPGQLWGRMRNIPAFSSMEWPCDNSLRRSTCDT